jgi:hypothetical protein
MMLFIGHIPAHSTERDFMRFVTRFGNGLLSWVPFVSKPALRKCHILRIEDQLARSVEFHGLLSIQPSKSSQNLLQKLDGKQFNGKPVEVRRYYKRSFRMDRRIIHTESDSLPVERRRRDRRRPALNTQLRPC